MPISTQNISKLDTFCDFLRFFETSFQKKRKSHVFLKPEKKT